VSAFTSNAPLSQELRGVAISLLVPLFEPNYPTSATRVYVGSSRSAHCATQAERNDAVQAFTAAGPSVTVRAGCVIAHSS